MSASVCKAGCISERVLSIGSRQGIRYGLEGQHDWERIVKQSDSAEMLVPSSGALILGVDRGQLLRLNCDRQRPPAGGEQEFAAQPASLERAYCQPSETEYGHFISAEPASCAR